MKNNALGFTMVELMIAVAVLSTLLAMALPSFHGLLARQHLYAAQSQLHNALMLARSSALDSGRRIALCPSIDGVACNNSSQWASGYLVFVDANEDRLRQAQEPLIRQLDADHRLKISSNSGRKSIVFFPDGSSPGSNTTLSLCALGHAQPARTLVLSNSGRLRSGQGAICAG